MNDNAEINFKEIFSLLKKRIWLILICAVLAGALVLTYTALFVTPMYTAKISASINNKAVNSGDTGMASSDLAVAIQLANTYVEIIKNDVILEPIIEEYDLDMTTDELRNMISAEVIDDTQLFKVEIESPSPTLAKKIATAIRDVAERDIPGLMQGSTPKFLGEPKVSQTPTSPNYAVNGIIGVLAGAILAAIGVIVASLLDVRVKCEEDLEKICPIPVLGMIPELSDETKPTKKKLPFFGKQKGGKR